MIDTILCAEDLAWILPLQIYNLSSDRPVTLMAYAHLTADLLGSRSEFRCVPIEEILATRKAHRSGLRFLCEHMCIDSGKARRDLGYHPRIDIRESLRDALAWMIAGGMLRAELKPAIASMIMD